MTKFVSQNRSEGDSNQSQIPLFVGSAVGSVIGVPHEKRQKEIKGPMNA